MTAFYNFNLKTETSWTKVVVQLTLETWNANDVVVCVWLKKKLKICYVKKNNSNCTKFPTWK